MYAFGVSREKIGFTAWADKDHSDKLTAGSEIGRGFFRAGQAGFEAPDSVRTNCPNGKSDRQMFSARNASTGGTFSAFQ